MTPKQRQNFDRLLSPRHIAFIGGRDALIAIGEAKRRGFKGEYWPVNPRREELGGFPCFADIDALPEAPDAVFLAIPAPAAVAAVDTLREIGAGGIVCYTAGFKEAGRDGQKLEQDLLNAVGDMALIGPNCYGIINYLDNSALWPFAHGGSCPGYGAAIITQSGMLSSDISMSQRSLPLTHMVSAGNQAVLGIEDFIDILCENPATMAIGLHIEGLSDIPKFEKAALKALAQSTPIVALKTGKSEIGSALTVSHTGSLSGSNDLYEALFDRLGIISVTNPSQLLETLKYLCVVEPPKGKNIAGFTCSGGGATMLADYGEEIGLEFPSFDSPAAHILEQHLPPIATVSNPLDYTTPIWGQPKLTEPVFWAALEHNDVQAAVLVQDYPAEGLDESKVFYQNDALAFATAAKSLGIPAAICATIPENLDKATREFLIAQGVAPMQGIEETLNAVSSAAWWRFRCDQLRKNPYEPMAPPSPMVGAAQMNEAEGKAIVHSFGVDIPKGAVTNIDGLTSVAEDIGYPVVLKMVGSGLEHKTEAGAVAINLKSAAELKDAANVIIQSVQQFDPDCLSDQFLVEAMANLPLAELVVAIRQDQQFGWVLAIGSGGVFVELIGDVKHLLLPTNAKSIESALRSLKIGKLLSGFRGAKPANFELLSNQILRLCQQMQSLAPDITELEINPLFVYNDKIMAVDVLGQKRKWS
ncbi:MAG: acetate--CoA ligase family protein [Paracoccaceae bacterium]|nr:acetate--CoA ligase family protein [Paracoccaceae bacterium]